MKYWRICIIALCFDKEEIKKEKNVILEEIRMYEDTPDEIVHDHFIETILGDHPLGHPIIGSVQSIKSIRREKLVDFFNEYYLNNNCMFVIAGKFDVDGAKRLVDRYFSTEKSGIISENSAREFHQKVFRKHSERDLEQVHFCLGLEGVNKNDDDRWALYILSTILGGSMSSRLFQNIREKEGLCYSIYSFHSSYAEKGIFGVYGGTSPENFEKVVDLILKECGELLDKGITDEELRDTRAYIKGNIALSMESTEVRMGQLARNEMNYGRYIAFDEIVRNIEAVTSDDIVRIAGRLFKNKKISLVSVGKINNEFSDGFLSL